METPLILLAVRQAVNRPMPSILEALDLVSIARTKLTVRLTPRWAGRALLNAAVRTAGAGGASQNQGHAATCHCEAVHPGLARLG
jgi:hypothetical protein